MPTNASPLTSANRSTSASASSSLRPISNHKPLKGKESTLSSAMRERLFDFYTGSSAWRRREEQSEQRREEQQVNEKEGGGGGVQSEGDRVVEYDVILSLLERVMGERKVVVKPSPERWKTEIWMRRKERDEPQ
jgi:hypothetical protein